MKPVLTPGVLDFMCQLVKVEDAKILLPEPGLNRVRIDGLDYDFVIIDDKMIGISESILPIYNLTGCLDLRDSIVLPSTKTTFKPKHKRPRRGQFNGWHEGYL